MDVFAMGRSPGAAIYDQIESQNRKNLEYQDTVLARLGDLEDSNDNDGSAKTKTNASRVATGATEEEGKGGGSKNMAAVTDSGGRQESERSVRLLVYAGSECELPALDGGMAPATGGLAAGGSGGG